MRIQFRKQSIPWVMAAGRAALGPVLIAGAACSWNGFTLAAIVVTALLSDIFDGMLALRWGCDTAGVRLFDSMADTVFYLYVAAALWANQPEVWRNYMGLLIPLLSLEMVRFGWDFAKFGKPASYHSYLAKSWGLTMALGVVTVLAMHHASPILSVALLLGIACNMEGLAMSVILPVWRKDVKSLRAAWCLRRELLATGSQAMPSGIRKAVVAAGVFAAVLGLPPSAAAFPVEDGQVAYVGGSAPIAQNTLGMLDTVSPTALAFRYKSPNGTANEININYRDIRSFTYRNEVAHHLGVLPLIAVSLVKARERKHIFLIAYADTTGATQVAIFEVSASDQRSFLEILRARDPQICSKPSSSCGGSFAQHLKD